MLYYKEYAETDSETSEKDIEASVFFSCFGVSVQTTDAALRVHPYVLKRRKNMFKSYSMELAGRTLTVDVGRVAAQANGAAFMHYGDTAVLSRCI